MPTRVACAAAVAGAFLACLGIGTTADAHGPRTGGPVTVATIEARGGSASRATVARALAVVRARLRRVDPQATVVQGGGPRSLELRFPELTSTAARADVALVDGAGQIAFYDLTPALLPPSIDAEQQPVPSTSLYALLRAAASNRLGPPSGYYLFQPADGRTLAGPAGSRSALLALLGGTAPPHSRILPLPAHSTVVSCGAPSALDCPGLTSPPLPDTTYYYLLKQGAYPGDRESPYPQLDAADLELADTRAGSDRFDHQSVVLLRFTRAGARRFQALTRVEAQRGQALGVQQSFAIVVDGRLTSFPTIDYEAYPDGIAPETGEAEITGLGSRGEAQRLALLLETGPLPRPFTLVSLRSRP